MQAEAEPKLERSRGWNKQERRRANEGTVVAARNQPPQGGRTIPVTLHPPQQAMSCRIVNACDAIYDPRSDMSLSYRYGLTLGVETGALPGGRREARLAAATASQTASREADTDSP